MSNLTLFDEARLSLTDSHALTVQSLQAYGATHERWAIAWSGGKDSTALLTFVMWLIASGQIPRPRSLTVLYVDTRLELPPLAQAAKRIMAQLRALGVDVRTVIAPMDKRFLVYMLGRGVPPPNNATLRWCTEGIKVRPMEDELRDVVGTLGGKVLMLTGVRQGESAIRDQRIAMSCGKNGAECGQGWFQETMPDALCDTLAPLLHWRVCHVWDWLRIMAPDASYGGWDTELLAIAYGGDEAEEINARTGCMGCPLTDKDTALDRLIRLPEWAHLEPLKGLRRLWRTLRRKEHRLRKHGGETRKDGSLVANQYRMGPITLESRLWALEVVLDIQARVNAGALAAGQPPLDMLNAQEEARIRELIAAGTWPNKWSGEEPHASEFFAEPDSLFAALASDGGACE